MALNHEIIWSYIDRRRSLLIDRWNNLHTCDCYTLVNFTRNYLLENYRRQYPLSHLFQLFLQWNSWNFQFFFRARVNHSTHRRARTLYVISYRNLMDDFVIWNYLRWMAVWWPFDDTSSMWQWPYRFWPVCSRLNEKRARWLCIC